MSIECVTQGSGCSLVALNLTGMEAGADLAGLCNDLDAPVGAYAVDVLSALEESDDLLGIEALAATIDTELSALAQGPFVLLGYCTSTMLALHLAARLEETRPRSVRAVLLLRPARPTMDTVAHDYDEIRATLGLDGGPLAWQQDPEGALSAALVEVTDAATRLFDPGDELEATVALELVARYRAWLGLLLASALVAAPALDTVIHQVCSAAAQPSGTLHLGPTPVVHAVDAPDTALLTNAESRARVLAVLARLAEGDA